MNRMNSSGRTWQLRHFLPGIIGVILALGLIMSGMAQAQTMLTGTFVGKVIGREVAFQHDGKAHNDWAGVLKLKLDDGPEVPVFCIQIQVRVRAGDRYRADGPVLALPNGCQIRYLLDKYPASTANTVDEAAARQMAIWVFSDGVDPTMIQDAAIRDRTIALVNEAKLGSCPTRRTEPAQITLAPPTTTAAPRQTIAYSVQASAEDAGQTVTVSVTGPALLTDASGAGSSQQQPVTLDAQGRANFWVTGTGAGETVVRVDLPYQLGAGTVFSHLDDGPPTQRLVLAEGRSLTASATAQVSWSASTTASPTATSASASTPTATPASASTPTATPASAPGPTATQPAATAAASPQPTRKPSQRSPTPGPEEQPTETVLSETQATASPAPSADIAMTPVGAPEAVGQVPPVDQTATGAAAGGAVPVRPASLPNTGATDAPVGWLLALIAALLALGGWLIRRRIAR
jgi:LPXTG-motif cell wall-anchored protein